MLQKHFRVFFFKFVVLRAGFFPTRVKFNCRLKYVCENIVITITIGKVTKHFNPQLTLNWRWCNYPKLTYK
jgi:hypothetical protein